LERDGGAMWEIVTKDYSKFRISEVSFKARNDEESALAGGLQVHIGNIE